MKGKCTRVAGVGIRLDGALGDLQIVLSGDLVEGVFTTAEKLAGIAMAIGEFSIGGVDCN